MARGLQIDVVYLGWPIAPSYMSPNAGEEGSCRVSANEYSCRHMVTDKAQLNFGDLTLYLTYGLSRKSSDADFLFEQKYNRTELWWDELVDIGGNSLRRGSELHEGGAGWSTGGSCAGNRVCSHTAAASQTARNPAALKWKKKLRTSSYFLFHTPLGTLWMKYRNPSANKRYGRSGISKLSSCRGPNMMYIEVRNQVKCA